MEHYQKNRFLEQLYINKFGTAASGFMYVKPVTYNLFCRQVAFTNVLRLNTISFFMVIKLLLYSKKIPANWLRNLEISFQEICAWRKLILGIVKKDIFSIKNICLYNLWHLAVLKTVNTHARVILAFTFFDNKNFLEALLF